MIRTMVTWSDPTLYIAATLIDSATSAEYQSSNIALSEKDMVLSLSVDCGSDSTWRMFVC